MVTRIRLEGHSDSVATLRDRFVAVKVALERANTNEAPLLISQEVYESSDEGDFKGRMVLHVPIMQEEPSG